MAVCCVRENASVLGCCVVGAIPVSPKRERGWGRRGGHGCSRVRRNAFCRCRVVGVGEREVWLCVVGERERERAFVWGCCVQGVGEKGMAVCSVREVKLCIVCERVLLR